MRFARTLLRPAAKLLPTGTQVPIMRGPLRGTRWIVGAAAGEGKGLSIVFNQSEPAQLQHATRILNEDMVCFDIGANVGFYTLLFARYGKEVYAFEPLARNIRYLSRTIEINKVVNARIIPVAMSAEPGIGLFTEGVTIASGALSGTGDVPVAVITCDQFVAETGVVPDLMKIDVEGGELNVLRGATRILGSRRPALLLSVHSDQLRSDCLVYLSELGYSTFMPLDAAELDGANEIAISA